MHEQRLFNNISFEWNLAVEENRESWKAEMFLSWAECVVWDLYKEHVMTANIFFVPTSSLNTLHNISSLTTHLHEV